MTISQELGDTLKILDRAYVNEDGFAIPKCLRKLDQNRVTVATWVFKEVAAVLNFPNDLFTYDDSQDYTFAQGIKNVRFNLSSSNNREIGRVSSIIRELEKIAHGYYAPGGREHDAIYWDGWDKNDHENVISAIQQVSSHGLDEAIKLYNLLQHNPAALNRWLGFGLGLIQSTPDAASLSEDDQGK